jgi:hypothetical protein
MNRSLVILAVVFLAIESSFGESLISEREVVGVWKVDPSTFRVRELAIPNPNPRPQLPTNFVAFKLLLKQDGSFVASNIPTAFFFESSPFTNECVGKWQIETNWPLVQMAHRNENGTTNWVIVQDSTNGYSELNLFFDSPSTQGNWGRHVYRFGRETPSFYMEVATGKDKTGTYEWSVAIRKQNLDDDK